MIRRHKGAVYSALQKVILSLLYKTFHISVLENVVVIVKVIIKIQT